MIPLVILKKLKLDNSDNIVKVVKALITVAILSKRQVSNILCKKDFCPLIQS